MLFDLRVDDADVLNVRFYKIIFNLMFIIYNKFFNLHFWEYSKYLLHLYLPNVSIKKKIVIKYITHKLIHNYIKINILE